MRVVVLVQRDHQLLQIVVARDFLLPHALRVTFGPRPRPRPTRSIAEHPARTRENDTNAHSTARDIETSRLQSPAAESVVVVERASPEIGFLPVSLAVTQK